MKKFIYNWFMKRLWQYSYTIYNWCEDKRPAGGFKK